MLGKATRVVSYARMKRQLADGREERQIRAAWRQYGAWLRDHDEALRDVERLLAVSVIRTGEQR